MTISPQCNLQDLTRLALQTIAIEDNRDRMIKQMRPIAWVQTEVQEVKFRRQSEAHNRSKIGIMLEPSQEVSESQLTC